ncbi:MAG: tyrosine-type recombinase/integrase [Deltaproteobacteria bacterium]|nr:tyrosine-type recombinase/integrase [Deltaproteobacteria bacterium]MBW2026358.1 tyrosine-type recombinase/integrase [Deltaproteobacteria bacterium]MBW2125496.1 tyrosine-type recombinase/integrase [Deltaproteobacteria bacterium]
MERNRKAREQKTKVTSVDGIKYFTSKEIKLLRRHVKRKAENDLKCGRKTAVREWMVVDLLTCTGLRVSEAANLRIKDLNISYGNSSIFVRNGKGNISGTVEIPASLKKHLKQFLRWKKEQGEGTSEDHFLFIGQRGKWTSQAIQQIVKKYLRQLNLYQNGKSVHALRHSYAVALYSKERDLRTVQKQLRHRSIQSTLVYADVTSEEIQSQIRGLWS